MTEEETSTSQLSGTEWKLALMGPSNGRPARVMDGTEVILSFEDGQINGNAGCNSLSGKCDIKEGKVQFSSIGTTRMVCPEPKGVMNQESQFISLLRQAEKYQITPEGTLRISCSGEMFMEFQQTK